MIGGTRRTAISVTQGLNARTVNIATEWCGAGTARFGVFDVNCELCTDVVNCVNCFAVTGALSCRNCRDSSFLFDCRNCSDCLFCWNLRNKRFCVENREVGPEEYQRIRAEYNMSSRSIYLAAKERFLSLIRSQAYWKAINLISAKLLQGIFFKIVNNVRTVFLRRRPRTAAISCAGVKLKMFWIPLGVLRLNWYTYLSFLKIAATMYSPMYNTTQSRRLEYCGFCHNCEDCFACWGLVGRQFHLLNRPLEESVYHQITAKIREQIRQQGLEGKFFPPSFTANAYDESLAGFFFPLTPAEAAREGFRIAPVEERPIQGTALVSEIPDRAIEPTSRSQNRRFGMWRRAGHFG